MGYPMTWQRVVNRNGLADGDYGHAPERHRARVPTDPTQGTTLSPDETRIGRHDHLAERVTQYEKAFQMLAGDLRRLESDVMDEQAVCGYIANRTGIDRDVVAAVLKEFLSW